MWLYTKVFCCNVVNKEAMHFDITLFRRLALQVKFSNNNSEMETSLLSVFDECSAMLERRVCFLRLRNVNS